MELQAPPKPLTQADVFAAKCPSRSVLDHLTSRWGVLILIALLEEKLRFAQLRRRVEGVSEKMLAQTLKTLEADGLVVRTAWPEVPPRVEYHLSSLGRQAAERVKALVDWVEGALPEIMEAREQHEGA